MRYGELVVSDLSSDECDSHGMGAAVQLLDVRMQRVAS
jgi:hypothetical protein